MMRRAMICALLGAAGVTACARSSGVSLGDASAVSAPTSVGAAPMFAISPAGRRAAAWVSAPGGGTDGRLYISVNGGAPAELRDSLGPIEAHGEAPPKLAWAPDGALVTAYVVARVIPGRRFPAGALRVARSPDGVHWSAPVTVTDDSTFGSHNFHALHAAPDGSLYVTWLDGRHGKSAVYMTRSTDGGRSWSRNRRVDVGEACPCCRTAIATAPDGALYVAWRSVLPGNVRDIVVARSTDGGATWSAPVRAHADDWVFEGCPHAGPSMRTDGDGVLHIAWWTGKEGAAGVWYARSVDGARTFESPVALGTADFSRPAHVQLALGDSGRVAVAWDDGTVATPRVLLRVSRDGGRTFARAEAVSPEGRAATFPVLALSGRAITVAWSEESAGAAAHDSDSARHANPNAPVGLHAVGEAQVMVRRGSLD
jgi:hypothetical protein